MARIHLPDADRSEAEQVWAMAGKLGEAVGQLSAEVLYGKRLLTPRVREAVRMKIATINGCNICMQWRVPAFADRGVTEDLYTHIDDPTNAEYSAAESLAIEYAEKFALDQRSIDDAFFDRLKEHFTEPEILELTILTADWMAFGRVTAVLDLDEACAWAPSATV
jgi:alkylhydroperoxidase family enzyme